MKHRKSTRKGKPFQAAILTVATVAALSSLSLAQITSAALTSSKTVTVSAGAQQWIVSSLTLNATNYETVTATFPALSGYSSYTLEWARSADFANSDSMTGSSTSFTVGQLIPNMTYYFHVQAVGAPTAGWSSTYTVTTPVGPSVTRASQIIAYDAAGELWNYNNGTGVGADLRVSLEPAGAAIPLDFYVTDWNNDGILDLITQNSNGTLIFRKGLATGGYTNTTLGSSGWATMDITVGKFKKTDTYPSIIAKDTVSNTLYVYGNPSGGALSARVQLGVGWGPYSPMNLVDWDQDGNIDILARRTDTYDLMLYRTDGAGTIINETRTTIGASWTFDSIHVLRGRGGAGTVGLLVRSANTGNILYYPIIKNAFQTREVISGGWNPYKIAGN